MHYFPIPSIVEQTLVSYPTFSTLCDRIKNVTLQQL